MSDCIPIWLCVKLRSHASSAARLLDDLSKRSTNLFANRSAFYTRQEYVKDGTKTLVASERPLSD